MLNRIAVKLLLILLAVSIYFYFQHPVLYRCTNLSAVVPVGDMKLVIDDIRISNLDEDKLNAQTLQGKLPWIYSKIINSNLPMELSQAFLKIAAFYTRRPLTNENVNIWLSGTLIYPTGIRNCKETEAHEILNCFDIGISHGYCNSKGCNSINGENYCTWQSHGTFILNDLDKDFTLAITDQATKKVSYVYFSPRWEKKRFMQGYISSWDTGPSQPVQDYINDLSHNNGRAAMEYIAPKKRKNFKSSPLHSEFKDADIRYTVDWDDSVANYNGAYRVIVEAGKYQDENQTDFVVASDNRLIFYTVKDSNGKLYIVLTQ